VGTARAALQMTADSSQSDVHRFIRLGHALDDDMPQMLLAYMLLQVGQVARIRQDLIRLLIERDPPASKFRDLCSLHGANLQATAERPREAAPRFNTVDRVRKRIVPSIGVGVAGLELVTPAV